MDPPPTRSIGAIVEIRLALRALCPVSQRSCAKMASLVGTQLAGQLEQSMQGATRRRCTPRYKSLFRRVVANLQRLGKDADPAGNVLTQLHSGSITPTEFLALKPEAMLTAAESKVEIPWPWS